MKFVGDVLFFENNPRIIESKIIEFILSLRNKGKSHGAILNYLHAIKIRQLNNRSSERLQRKVETLQLKNQDSIFLSQNLNKSNIK